MEHIYKSPYEDAEEDLPNESIFDYLYKRLCQAKMEKSTKPWLIDASTGTEVPFCDIEPKSRKIASALTRLGFAKGDVLHFVTYEITQIYLVQLAVWRLGGAVRGTFQNELPSEIARQNIEAKARFILGDEETLPLLREAIAQLDKPIRLIVFSKNSVEGAITFDELLNDDGSAFHENVKIDANDITFAANTSGSTGVLKGAAHTHRSMIALIFHKEIINYFQDTFMTPMSNFAIGAFVVTLGSIANGSLVFHLGKFEREDFFNNLVKYKPATAVMYPFVATWFARHDKLATTDLSFLKAILCFGGIIDPTTMEILYQKFPNVQIKQLYGMSECAVVTNTERVPKLVIKENDGDQWVSSGKLTHGMLAKVVDVNTGESLGPGKRGEIRVKSAQVMKGYLSKDTLEPVQTSFDKDGWYSTGDIGFFDEDGHIFITERLSFIFKYFHTYISPTEIENVLQKHPGVIQVVVVGLHHPDCFNVARAFVVRKGEVTEKELCDFVAERLISYKHLHGGVRFVEKLPITKGGKVDRATMKKIAIEMN
ncbi:uncharacterized protein LOC132202323 [Neocloeon triangulifer]|uniref:uncharacterized protein LOC132202323 n=1 Tax=Neocloeon triangulifer TaxID=2078957 RepID=UPI00286F6074|nr:uncharacterized protein LOC132202323 [Neocloeon triangulifer]